MSSTKGGKAPYKRKDYKMKTKYDNEQLEKAICLINAAYSCEIKKYKVVGRKLIIPGFAKDETGYCMIFDIPSIFANLNKKWGYNRYYFPKPRYMYKTFEETCLHYEEEYNVAKVKKNYLKLEKERRVKEKDFGRYREGGIYYTSWGYDETHIDFYLCTKIVGQTIYLQKIGKEVDYEGGCGMYQKSKPNPKIFVGEEFKKKLVYSDFRGGEWYVTVDRDVLGETSVDRWHDETGPYGGR